MINFLHTFNPSPLIFQLSWLSIRWYGLLVVLGIISGFLVVLHLAKKLNLDKESVYDLGFYLIIFGLLGARLYAVILELPYYLNNPAEIIAVWHGGLAIHGAIIAGAITLIVFARRKKQSFWLWADLLAVALPLGQAIGRWGNYFNQELFGRPTQLPWGIPIALSNRPAGYTAFQYFHPAFLYESILNLLNFFVLLFLFNLLRNSKFKNQKSKLLSGTVALIYLINYSIIRIIMEFFRIDSAPVVLGIRLPVIVSGLVIFSSVIVLWHWFKKSRQSLTPQER